MNFKNIIIVIFIAIFCFNNKIAYSQNIETNSITYKFDKQAFFNNEQLLYTTSSINSQLIEEQRIETIYKTGLFLPGVGQFMFGDYLKTLIFTPAFIALIGVFVYGANPSVGAGWGILAYSLPALMYTIILSFISGIDLSITYEKKLRELDKNITYSQEQEKIDQIYLMNVYLPGLGNIYSGDILRSIFYISAAGGIIIYEILKKSNSDTLAIVLVPLLYGISLIDSTFKHELDKKQLAKVENTSKNKTYLPEENIKTNNSSQNLQILSYSFKF